MKELIFPFNFMEYMGVLVVFFMAVLANAAGLGGGGLLIPFMMIFLNLSIFESVPLANIFGLLASLCRFVINFKQLHPNKEKAKVGKLSLDYEVVQLSMPMLYLGTLFGV